MSNVYIARTSIDKHGSDEDTYTHSRMMVFVTADTIDAAYKKFCKDIKQAQASGAEIIPKNCTVVLDEIFELDAIESDKTSMMFYESYREPPATMYKHGDEHFAADFGVYNESDQGVLGFPVLGK